MTSSRISLPRINHLGLQTLSLFLRPIQILKNYERGNLKPDLLAGLTLAIVLLPQAIAYALIAELPPQAGLYTAIVGAIVGALWGSSNHLHFGPTNTTSLLVLATLLPIAEAGSSKFIAAAGVLAIMVGLFQLVIGVSRLGVLVNFISDSVVIGFTAGAGVLIGVNQMKHLLRLDLPSSSSLITTVDSITSTITETHWPSLLIGFGVLLGLSLQRRFKPKWPGALLGMILAASVVGIFHLESQGVLVIGELPRRLPPLASLPFDFYMITQLSAGALAVGAIGMVESTAISRSIASQSGQQLDSNQEFTGQGLANLISGLFSGYCVSGSLTRSAVGYHAGARTSVSSIFSSIFLLFAMLILAPLAAYVPRAALAGVLLVTAYGLIEKREIARIARGTRGDALIMIVTFLATLFLPLQFAVITGILLSFAVYILRTSVPRVVPVLPADNFRHFLPQDGQEPCPQMSIIDIYGDLYFGAVTHVEATLRQILEKYPTQRFMLLRMFSVNQIDISGVHALESIMRTLRDRGGDLYMMRTQQPIVDLMKSIGFYDFLGAENFLQYDKAIRHLFYHVLDPAICIYECEERVFMECQNLPRPAKFPGEVTLPSLVPKEQVKEIDPSELWRKLHQPDPPKIIDVREPREFRLGHIMKAESIPLLSLQTDPAQIPRDQPVVCVCRSGRRSTRAILQLSQLGYQNIQMMSGGMLAWEAAGLLVAVD